MISTILLFSFICICISIDIYKTHQLICMIIKNKHVKSSWSNPDKEELLRPMGGQNG